MWFLGIRFYIIGATLLCDTHVAQNIIQRRNLGQNKPIPKPFGKSLPQSKQSIPTGSPTARPLDHKTRINMAEILISLAPGI